MLCSLLSFLRKQESRLPASSLWIPDQVRYDESVRVRLQLIVKRSSGLLTCSAIPPESISHSRPSLEPRMEVDC